MPDSPNKISQFWQELKRRKVVRVITVYAAAAFVILEAVDIIFPRMGFPDWTVTFVIFLIVIGFIITVIVSWIYDIHPEGGIVKTEPAHKVKEEETPKSSNSWKIASYISFVVIVVMVCVLLYPKIFKTDKLSKLRDKEGMISLAVLPFDNLTGDASLYFWQNGISEYLINGLGSSDELLVSVSQVVSDVLEGTRQVNASSLSPDIARRTASKINASIYITGNFIGKESDASIMLNLVNTENGELIWSTRVDGDLESNYRMVLDRLSDTVRNFMEIRALEKSVETDFTNAYPKSAEAYKYYIDGLNAIMDSRYENAIASLSEAYEIDSTFTFAAFYLAFVYNFSGQMGENQFRWARKAYELKDNLHPAYRPWIELWHTQDLEDIEKYCDIMLETTLHSRFLFFDLGTTYSSFLENYDKAISAYKKVEELNRRWEDDWRYERYYTEYTWALLRAARPEEVEHIADIGLKINPKNDVWVRRKGAAAIMMGDSAAVQRYIEDFSSLAKENGYTEAFTEYLLGNMYLWAYDYRQAADHYRRAYELDREDQNSLIWLIYSQLRGDLNIEECLTLSEYGHEQYPENWGFLWGKGYSLHKIGRDREALAVLLPLKELAPTNKELQRDIQEVEQSIAQKQQ